MVQAVSRAGTLAARDRPWQRHFNNVKVEMSKVKMTRVKQLFASAPIRRLRARCCEDRSSKSAGGVGAGHGGGATDASVVFSRAGGALQFDPAQL